MGPLTFFFTTNFIFVVTESPMQISEPYDNSFWEKSNPAEEREKRNNAVNSGHLVP
jgi:hypothetical protein